MPEKIGIMSSNLIAFKYCGAYEKGFIMRSYTILALAAFTFFGWSFVQAQEASEVLKKEFEKKSQMEQSYFYQIDHVAIASSSKLGGAQ